VVDRLSAEDRVMLWPEARWPQHLLAVLVLDGPGLLGTDGRLRLEDARGFIAERLPLVPRLRQRLVVPRLGGPHWVDDPAFDIRRHVSAVGVPPPGDDVALLEVVEQLRRRPLDHSKPLWDMCFLTGLAGDRIGLVVRLHHVVADGRAALTTLSAFLGPAREQARQRAAAAHAPRQAPSTRTLVTDPTGRRSAPSPVRLLLARPHPVRTSLDHVVGADRTMSLLRTDLATARQVARDHDATVNDVLLAVTAAGIGGILRSRDGIPPRLPVYVPVSLRPRDGAQPGAGNLIGQMVVSLPLDLEDPHERLREIARATAEVKRTSHPPLGALLGTRVGRMVLLALLDRYPISVTTADLVGPREPCWFMGSRVLEILPVLPLIGSVTLGVSALSYAGSLVLLAVADAQTCPDLDAFAAAARRELTALRG
jgi:WS/DGAT/MGAT family acyltransferase